MDPNRSLPVDPPVDAPSQEAAKAAPQRIHRLPRVCFALYALGVISALLYVLFRFNASFADWFNHSISSVCRRIMAYGTAIFPFSVAELLVLLSPMIVTVVIVWACRKYCDSWRSAAVFLGILLSVVALILSIFVWIFSAGYSAPTLDEKLELQREKVNAEQLYQTAQLLNEELHAITPQIIFSEDGASIMPYSYSEMNERLLAAYDRFCEKNDLTDDFHSRVKPIMLSEPMSYSHITGVYTFFTGEANINVNFPDYTIPYTAAHELAHQRGIAREDEANFIAFLVCMESDDPYIRYSAYLNVYEYVLSALGTANRELYLDSYSSLPAEVIAEEAAYSRFYDKYRENVVADISEATNDAYLQIQGSQEGTRSYNLVVDLTVAYYRSLGRVN